RKYFTKHDKITEQLLVRHYIIEEKLLVPWIQVDGCEIADLPTDPVAARKIPLKLSDTLLQQVVPDVDAQQRDVPEISPLFEVHSVSLIDRMTVPPDSLTISKRNLKRNRTPALRRRIPTH